MIVESECLVASRQNDMSSDKLVTMAPIADFIENRIRKSLERHEAEAGMAAYQAMRASLQPRDAAEDLLVAQMFVTGLSAIRPVERAALLYTPSESEETQQARNIRHARLYTQQMESLRKYRNGGSQTITIQHLNADKAIVGSVSSGKA